jgi:hypothetical protein
LKRLRHSDQLLTRDQFRERVFARDRGRCVLCPAPAVDAHHILERKLFPDGGYRLNNGASVCGPCHLRCERCDVSVEEIRRAAGITEPVLPPGFSLYGVVDKWGNELMPDGRRIAGPLGQDGLLKAGYTA